MKTVSTSEAAGVLNEGGVVIVPTETVVGLVAAEAGLRRLPEIKGRDTGKPIALLCPTKEAAFEMVSEVPAVAGKLAQLYWPGPLTLVLRQAGGRTIGVRVPDHEVVKELLAAYGGPLYATSANIAGEPPPASLDEVDRRVAEAVDAVLEGETGKGEASAVVDLSGERVRLLRAGEDLTEEKLLRIVGGMKDRV